MGKHRGGNGDCNFTKLSPPTDGDLAESGFKYFCLTHNKTISSRKLLSDQELRDKSCN